MPAEGALRALREPGVALPRAGLPALSDIGRPRDERGLLARLLVLPLGVKRPLLLRCAVGVIDMRCRATLHSMDMCWLSSHCRTSRPHAGHGTTMSAILRSHCGMWICMEWEKSALPQCGQGVVGGGIGL